jgi:hypothetical protein
MNTGNTTHAVSAMNALHSSCFQNSVIRGSIWDPTWGDDHNHPNAPLFVEMEWYLSCRQVAHAGDVFNTYCQSVLAEVLKSDPAIWGTLPKNLLGKNRDVVIQKLEQQSGPDGRVREALRDYISVFWCNEIEIIAVLRNKIVHQAGLDFEGVVAESSKKFPPCLMQLPPASLDPNEFPVDTDISGKLVIDAKTGYWAAQHVQHLINIMDQTLCKRFGLVKSLEPIKRQTFRTKEGNKPRTLLPGVPLPRPQQEASPPSAPVLPPLKPPTYEIMFDPLEQACAKSWSEAFSAIHDFILKTCEEVGVAIASQSGSVAGRMQSDTLEGHDRELSYELQSCDAERGNENTLGIRLRQQDFHPFITIWSTKTQMIDYRPCELSDEVTEHLIRSIQQTISG